MVESICDVDSIAKEELQIANNNRIDKLMCLFHSECQIMSLKTKKILLTNSISKDNTNAVADVSAMRMSFTKALIHPSEPNYRIFIQDESVEPTFCIDYYKPGTSPGLGDSTKNMLIVYRIASNQITHIYGIVDSILLPCVMGSQPRVTVTKEMVLNELYQQYIVPIIKQDITNLNTNHIHFNDYTAVETIG